MPMNEISWDAEAEGAVDLLANPALADFTSVNGLAKAFVDTKAMQGQSIRIPSSEASSDDMVTFHESLREKVPGLMPTPDLTNPEAMNALMVSIGRPEKEDGYEVPTVEGVTVTDEQAAVLRKNALESGLTKKQFDKWLTTTFTADIASTTAKKETVQQELQGLRNEWGTAFDSKFAQAVKIAEATNAPPEVIKALKEQTAGVATVKWFDGLVGALGSEDFQLATLPPGSGGITTLEARERATEIRNKLSSMSESHPDREGLIKKMMDFDRLGKEAA
jgi:hypothetical protein